MPAGERWGGNMDDRVNAETLRSLAIAMIKAGLSFPQFRYKLMEDTPGIYTTGEWLRLITQVWQDALEEESHRNGINIKKRNSLICNHCGQYRTAFHGKFYENRSYCNYREERTVDAKLCFYCTAKVFGLFTSLTLIGTWWGFYGTILGPFYILSNIGWFFFNVIRFIFVRR